MTDKVRLNITFTDEQYKYIKSYGEKKGQAISAVIRDLIHEHIQNNPSQKVEVYNAKGQKELVSANDDVTLIPLLPFHGSCGHGQTIFEDLEYSSLRKEPFFTNFLGKYKDERLFMIEAKGDSMKDASIVDGDFVVFVRGLERDNGIYVVQLGSEIYIKHVEFKAWENKIFLKSRNKEQNYDDIIVNIDSEAFTIYGKVISWVHRNVD